MIKAYILDDEVRAVELLRRYVSQIDFLELVGSSANSLNAFSFLHKNPVDVLFLDINMPLLSGLDLYRSLNYKPKVIFTTAHPEHAVEGFELDATDYLLKPITFARFLLACEKIHRDLSNREESRDESKKLLSETVYLKSGTTTHKISWQDVLYLEKEENYVNYQTKNQKILCRTTMTRLEPLFPNYIVRVHQSFAVSLIHVSKITNSYVEVEGTKIPIGRSYKKNLDRL